MTSQENGTLTRVGTGTPMGNCTLTINFYDARPAARSLWRTREIALTRREFVAFRRNDGLVGFVDEAFDPDLPHTTILAVPIDDDHTLLRYVGDANSGIVDPMGRAMMLMGATQEMSEEDLSSHGLNAVPIAPRNYNNFRDTMPYHLETLWGQDRARMATGHHTGLPGLGLEDIAVTDSMGTSIDHTRETLNITDAFVARFRRRLLSTVQAHADGVPAPEIENSRAIARDGFVPPEQSWRDLPRFPREPRLSANPDLANTVAPADAKATR